MTDWMMVVLTAVYVVATILICYYSYCSAKASKEQTQELRRQYLAENRPYITVEVIYEQRTYYGLRLTNHGKRVANHVKIQFGDKFLESINESNSQLMLKQQNGKECIIGIGQHRDIIIGSNKFRERPQQVPILAKITYSDSAGTYEDELNIDFAIYSTFFSVESDIEKVKQGFKKQTRELHDICAALEQIADKICNVPDLDEGSEDESIH